MGERVKKKDGKQTDKVYMVIPAYNEAENIYTVVDEWYRILEKEDIGEGSRLLVIDDGSKDETFQILNGMKEGRPKLLAVTKPNSGHGATLLYGYRYALKEGADYIFQTDSDGQTRPEEFRGFWKLRANYDMVIGDPRLLWRKSDGCQYAFSSDGCKGFEKTDEIYSKGI